MKKIIITERLYLRELNVTDYNYFYNLNLDIDVLKYTGDKPFKNLQGAKKFLKNYNHYKKYGCGRWAVIDKNNDVFLGWCGIKFTQSLNEYDIGFRFFKKYWGKGFATES
ncbi:GNAT family N-acetyltransferase, partial [Lutibacter sp.]|uniref:GNAT family N-acetyltransferase n=1 Tax=Lutibacter sp. TaxID=1925666 RepID=UPI00349FF83E